VVGVGVALAARLLDHAAPGAVVVSSAVRDALVGGAERFVLIGPAELKGIPGVWDIHRVRF
jgi:class 3 adenylate cyclase